MYRVFNMGIGFDSRGAGVSLPSLLSCARNGIGRPGCRIGPSCHRRRYAIGGVCRLSGRMRFESPCWHPGRGSNLQAVIDAIEAWDGSGEDCRRHQQQERGPGVRNEPADMDCRPLRRSKPLCQEDLIAVGLRS